MNRNECVSFCASLKERSSSAATTEKSCITGVMLLCTTTNCLTLSLKSSGPDNETYVFQSKPNNGELLSPLGDNDTYHLLLPF